ncbi:H-type small acid-soluble spore protein [Lentibacillus saliphilus]|uniref:H-type small acid-soluble spore protein n=1 Tax=Lentibacillus saliphilus TaxID=2737028 RepID=UPI001C2F2F8A|nr:H-type small acid-soluble spore protein [Lentibacillus saliphilus]
MDLQRAKEIVESGKLIRVTFEGKEIYIQHVDEDKKTARVYPLDDPASEFDVTLDQLVEQ